MPRPNKKQKTTDDPIKTASVPKSGSSKSTVRRLKGRLQALPKMPMDILFEIFSHLQPLDILRLARTNKSFRDLLMNRDSTHIWKAARKNVPDLPEPFPGMSEPAFAKLCFESQCFGCPKPNIREVIWEWRVRYCNDCKKANCVDCTDLMELFSRVRSYKDLPFNLSLVNILPKSKPRLRVLAAEAEEFTAIWKELDTEAGRQSFFKERAAQRDEIAAHTILCREWLAKVKDARIEELDRIRRQRLHDITAKLHALGYEKDLIYGEETYPIIYQLCKLEAVDQPKPLTERGWQKIKPVIISYVETFCRSARLRHEYALSMKSRIKVLKQAWITFARSYGSTPFPRVEDFALIPAVRSILDVRENVELKQDSFDVLVPDLPSILEYWRADVVRRLDRWIRARDPEIPPDIQISDLASTHLIRCTDCHYIFSLTDASVALHRCPYSGIRDSHWMFARENRRAQVNDDYLTALEMWGLERWHPADFYLLHKSTKLILDACNVESVCTVKELDKLDPRLRCSETSCCNNIYTWREAIIHNEVVHGRRNMTPEKVDRWKMLSQDEVQDMSKSGTKDEQERRIVCWCFHCGLRLEKEVMKRHVKEAHEIETPGDEDMIEDVDQPMWVKKVP